MFTCSYLVVQFPLGVERVDSSERGAQQLDVVRQQRAAQRRQRAAQLLRAPRALRALHRRREEVAPAVDQHAATPTRSREPRCRLVRSGLTTY